MGASKNRFLLTNTIISNLQKSVFLKNEFYFQETKAIQMQSPEILINIKNQNNNAMSISLPLKIGIIIIAKLLEKDEKSQLDKTTLNRSQKNILKKLFTNILEDFMIELNNEQIYLSISSVQIKQNGQKTDDLLPFNIQYKNYKGQLKVYISNDFKKILNGTSSKKDKEFDMIKNVKLNLKVLLGNYKIPLNRLNKQKVEDIYELDTSVNQPLKIYLENVVIGEGEVVTIDNNFGIEITKIYEKALNDFK